MTPIKTPLPWWRTDLYDGSLAVPGNMVDLAGPKGIAIVRAFKDGRTDPGWGDDKFMANYMKGEFIPRRGLKSYEKGLSAFAFVMRSMKLVAVDIDGKNGGLEHAKKLGALPPTMAETSKSGDGYHLFYLVDDVWDDELGFAGISDRIGIETGVDIRGTGCVYHHDTQRWNDRMPVMLPQYLRDLLVTKQQERQHRAAHVAAVLNSTDPMEILMLQEQLTADLAKPIPAGKRNNTLYAIGVQMKEAAVPGWENLVDKRANDVGLSADETDKLIKNIQRSK